MRKKKKIEMTRNELKDLRYKYGYDKKFTIEKVNPYKKFIETLKELKKRGEKSDENEKL